MMILFVKIFTEFTCEPERHLDNLFDLAVRSFGVADAVAVAVVVAAVFWLVGVFFMRFGFVCVAKTEKEIDDIYHSLPLSLSLRR